MKKVFISMLLAYFVADKTFANGDLKNVEIVNLKENVISFPVQNEAKSHIDLNNAKPMPLPSIEAPKALSKPSNSERKKKGTVENGKVGSGKQSKLGSK